MKRTSLLVTVALVLVAAMALSGVAQAKGKPSSTKCQQEAASLSLTGYTFVGGSDRKNDDFGRKGTEGRDVFCGFGGDDRIGTLAAGDIFLGGAGSDSVPTANIGTFYGGDGDDSGANDGTFYGEEGNDSVVGSNNWGTFYGGAGNDSVVHDNYIAFYGGAGDDSVGNNARTTIGNVLTDAIFDGGAGNDSVTNLYSGTFNGDDNDSVTNLYPDGTFNGGLGEDSIANLYGGTYSSVELLPAP